MGKIKYALTRLGDEACLWVYPCTDVLESDVLKTHLKTYYRENYTLIKREDITEEDVKNLIPLYDGRYQSSVEKEVEKGIPNIIGIVRPPETSNLQSPIIILDPPLKNPFPFLIP